MNPPFCGNSNELKPHRFIFPITKLVERVARGKDFHWIYLPNGGIGLLFSGLAKLIKVRKHLKTNARKPRSLFISI